MQLLCLHSVILVAADAAAAVAIGTDEDEYYEVDDLEEMHTAIINDDYDQVWCNFQFHSFTVAAF